jgi:RNA recognition motif-containing protein
MSWALTAGKREREMRRDRRKKEKQERLQRNRMMRAQGREQVAVGQPEQMPEVKLEDVVIGVAPQPRRNTSGPVKLFVGGLSWNTTADDLRAAFGNFGSLEEATVLMDRGTGRSRGFGFVTFSNPEQAAVAVERMNGATLDGRSLKVNNAESR